VGLRSEEETPQAKDALGMTERDTGVTEKVDSQSSWE